MLTQLRACAYLKQKGIETFAYSETDMTQFCKLYISALLFNAGGHSLFEFSSPLFLSEVKQEFKFKTMSLKSMFFDNNEAAFNQALNAAIAYNQSILVRKKVLTELLLSKSAQKSEQRLLVGLSLAINCKSDMDTYSTLVKDQSLYAFRPGHKKLDLIESHGQKALNDLKVGQLSKALNKFQHLKMILTSQYGSTTCWGGKPASIAMLDFVEEALATVIETIAAEHRQIDGPQEAELPPSASSS